MSATPTPSKKSPYVCLSLHCDLLGYVGGRPHPYAAITADTVLQRGSKFISFYLPDPINTASIVDDNAGVESLLGKGGGEDARLPCTRVDTTSMERTLFPTIKTYESEEEQRINAAALVQARQAAVSSSSSTSAIASSKQRKKMLRRTPLTSVCFPSGDRLATDAYLFNFFGTVPSERVPFPESNGVVGQEQQQQQRPGERTAVIAATSGRVNASTHSTTHEARSGKCMTTSKFRHVCRVIHSVLITRAALQTLLILCLPDRSPAAAFQVCKYQASTADLPTGQLVYSVSPRCVRAWAASEEELSYVFTLQDSNDGGGAASTDERICSMKRAREEEEEQEHEESDENKMKKQQQSVKGSASADAAQAQTFLASCSLQFSCARAGSAAKNETLFFACTTVPEEAFMQSVGDDPITAAAFLASVEAEVTTASVNIFLTGTVLPLLFTCMVMQPSADEDDRATTSSEIAEQAKLNGILQRRAFLLHSYVAHLSLCLAVHDRLVHGTACSTCLVLCRLAEASKIGQAAWSSAMAVMKSRGSDRMATRKKRGGGVASKCQPSSDKLSISSPTAVLSLLGQSNSQVLAVVFVSGCSEQAKWYVHGDAVHEGTLDDMINAVLAAVSA